MRFDVRLAVGTSMALLGALLAWPGSIEAAWMVPDPAWHAPVEGDGFDPSSSD